MLLVDLDPQGNLPEDLGYGPLEIFHKIGYRANPFLTLVIAALVMGQIVGGHTSMHLPRQTSTQQPAERHGLKTEFNNWLANSESCDITTGEAGKKVRPMILLAAEGGGNPGR